MSIRAKIIGKTIDTTEIKRMFVQGESDATEIDFVLRPEHAGLQWTIRGVMEYYGTVALQILTVTETETEVVVNWPVSNLFTVGNGLMHLSLVGARENGTVVVKAVGNVEVKQDYSVDTMPTVTPNLFEQLMAEIEDAEAAREAAEEAREENEADRQAEIEKLANMEVELTALEPEETPTSSLTDIGTAFLLALGLPRGQRGPQGDTGAQGVSAYVHIRYAAAQPTQDSDMKTSPDAWIGIYAGTSAEAPTAYTSYAWYQYKGATGDTGPQGAAGDTGAQGEQGAKGDKGDQGEGFQILGYYATLAALEATVTDPQPGDAYGVGSAAPYDIYTYDGVGGEWVNNGPIQGAKGDKGVKGDTGDTGAQGVSAYVHIRYAAAQPTQDSDMKTSPDAWIGIYAGTSAEAPTAYTSYAWYQYKGATGDTGPQGATGDTGDPGAGVPTGGTTGQVLQKASNDDRDTEWGDPPEKASTLTALLDADEWEYSVDRYEQTIAISGLAVSGYCYIVSADPASAGEYAKRGVLMQDVTVANTATFYAASAPDTDITAYIAKIQEG